jgi:hypothetical protein
VKRQPIAWLVPPILGLAPEAASWSSRPCNVAGAPAHVFIRTFQRQGHPHPALSRSTAGKAQALSGAAGSPYEPSGLGTRLHPVMSLLLTGNQNGCQDSLWGFG